MFNPHKIIIMKPTNSIEVSEKLGISVKSVVSIIKEEDIPYRYLDRKYIFDEEIFMKKFFNPSKMKKGSTNKRPPIKKD